MTDDIPNGEIFKLRLLLETTSDCKKSQLTSVKRWFQSTTAQDLSELGDEDDASVSETDDDSVADELQQDPADAPPGSVVTTEVVNSISILLK